ncbi:DNA methyltransferase [Bacteroidia bacterium]|nr:DNA methyltransferase [Bacteroidia bacterium]
MQQHITQYITEVNKLYLAGNATEHSYRPALKTLLEALMPQYTATNEPKRIACGAPDYIISDRNFAVGYVEAKDIPVNLNDKTLKEQFDRYRHSLDNLVITNYLIFRWYAKGELVEEIAIGRESDNKIVSLTDNFGKFMELIRQFAVYHTEGIKNSAELSKQMAAKARLLAEIIETSLNKDIENKEETELNNQYEGFKSILIDTISTKDFADLYAQTIAYGMFAARINYNETKDFTREKAAKSIPQTNPFLRKMFGFIAGVDLDSRISWVVDALADLFNYVDIAKIHAEIGRYADNDPIIHFYETFLNDYDKRLKKQRGVWYTPQPVVRFIVRAVDEILKTDFGISAGLADSGKVMIGDSEYHKVQILDPATGTGTFLAEVVGQIYKQFENQQGMWSDYVNKHLIPRLNGFEILMASYAMAHLKLEMLLQETNANITNQRLKIYLTDSLTPAPDNKQQKAAFAKWLTDEANEAAHIKRDTPVMVILGNPPYSGESINKGEWILKQIEPYKKDENGATIENTKWLNNDYVKFIRLGQYFIEKNKDGILAFITDNSFLDSLTFKGMRYNLLKTFDKIYILNLHGNSLKKETAPNGDKDENVFDIQQGVSINIFVKTPNTNTQPAQIFQYDIFGKREEKYNFLLDNDLQTVKWQELRPVSPDYFFVPKDFSLKEEYDKGFKINELFNLNGVGICSKRDETAFLFDKQQIELVVNDFKNLTIEQLKQKYNTEKSESRDKQTAFAKNNILNYGIKQEYIQKITYRPFDMRWTYFTNKSKGFLAYPVYDLMQHFVKGKNVGLVVAKTHRQLSDAYYFVTSTITDLHILDSAADATYIFPLYLYQENFGQTEKVVNMNEAIVNGIIKNLGNQENLTKITVQTIFDYIYAVLHSPLYREKYKEFLKIDFPRIPYPDDAERFSRLAVFGERLRELHLMENVETPQSIANFPVAGTNEIEKPEYTENKVFINNAQYFDNVPQSAWNFYIGGYQPAQKWLKDRKGRKLGFDDLQHYQKVIAVLVETEQIMKEINVNL